MSTPDDLLADPASVLAALEQQHDWFAYRIDGWSAWRVMRNSIHRVAVNLPLAQPTQSTPHRILQAAGATLRLFGLLITGRRRDVLVKTCRSGLRMRQGDKYRDVYFDGLLQNAHTSVKLEEMNSSDFDVQALNALHPADLDPVVFTFWGRVLGTLFPVKAQAFCDEVASILEQSLSLKIEPRFLLMRVSTVYWQARLYSILLKRVQPQAVLVSDTGEYALRLAAQRLGVRFIELQHGVFDASHPDAIPCWATGTAKELLLPDFLACRGVFWIEQLAGSRQGRDHAVPVGNELIDLARRKRENRQPDGCLQIVLSTQGLDSQRLADWVCEMIRVAPNDVDWKISIKLHPVYDAGISVYAELAKDPRVQVIGGSDLPNVFDLLADADLHMSIASACHFDAAALGVPTVVVPLAGHEAMLDAIDNSSFFLASKPDDVWGLCTKQFEQDESKAGRYAQPGFVRNLENLLSKPLPIV